MRIALFSGNYNYIREGANQALNRLVHHLEARGDSVRVYSPVTPTPAFEPAGTLVPVRSVPLPVRGEFRLAMGLSRSIRADIARFAPDIAHVATPDILDTRAQTFARRLGVPVLASLHTRFETYLEHYGLGWTRPLVEAHLKRFYRRADHVLAPTEALAAEMRALRGDDHVSLWSRGVDRELFSPARRDEAWRTAQGFEPDDVVVLFFGRLVLEKGVDDYVAVVRRLRQQGEKVRPLVVGAGPAEGRFAPLKDAVFAGHLQGEDLARAVASADILLHPSRSEAFGNVVLEAMASGLAIVGADADSAQQLLAHGQTGLLCASESYADAMTLLIRSPDRRMALGTAARVASQSYDWASASASAASAYEAVLARQARGRAAPASQDCAVASSDVSQGRMS